MGDDQGANEGNCSVGPDPYKQGSTGQECEVQGQSWLQLPRLPWKEEGSRRVG